MRYKDDEIIQPLTKHASDDMLIITAVIAVAVGIALTVLGRLGKQMWMWVWGIGLIIISLYMGISIAFDIKLFTYF